MIKNQRDATDATDNRAFHLRLYRVHNLCHLFNLLIKKNICRATNNLCLFF